MVSLGGVAIDPKNPQFDRVRTLSHQMALAIRLSGEYTKTTGEVQVNRERRKFLKPTEGPVAMADVLVDLERVLTPLTLQAGTKPPQFNMRRIAEICPDAAVHAAYKAVPFVADDHFDAQVAQRHTSVWKSFGRNVAVAGTPAGVVAAPASASTNNIDNTPRSPSSTVASTPHSVPPPATETKPPPNLAAQARAQRAARLAITPEQARATNKRVATTNLNQQSATQIAEQEQALLRTIRWTAQTDPQAAAQQAWTLKWYANNDEGCHRAVVGKVDRLAKNLARQAEQGRALTASQTAAWDAAYDDILDSLGARCSSTQDRPLRTSGIAHSPTDLPEFNTLTRPFGTTI